MFITTIRSNLPSHGPPPISGGTLLGYSAGGLSQGELMVGWLVDEVVSAFCMTAWASGTAHADNSNLELTGADQQWTVTVGEPRAAVRMIDGRLSRDYLPPCASNECLPRALGRDVCDGAERGVWRRAARGRSRPRRGS